MICATHPNSELLNDACWACTYYFLLSMKCVVATTTKLTTETPIQETRTRLTLKTIRQCQQRGLDIICIDSNSCDRLRNEMISAGAIVFPQAREGSMGVARREAIRRALD